ncbi:MAG: hypothetical protein KDA85_18625 [Planctomycetaceae bacterium]|nr:hypothetical protein [Planctomycetaceae bacterium]
MHQKRIGEFETTLDGGGQRLAVSHDGRRFAVGAWEDHGIALYDAENGIEIWRRKDLNQVQVVRISEDDRCVQCEFENSPHQTLSLSTGQALGAFRGVADFWESRYDSVVVFEESERDYRLMNEENELIANLPRQTFACLDFAFAPQKFCISESTGAIRCFNVTNGVQLWRYDPGNGSHAIGLTYNELADEVAAIVWSYEEGGPCYLKTFDADNGRVKATLNVGQPHELAFCCAGSLLVTSDGKLRETATGDDCGMLKFF